MSEQTTMMAQPGSWTQLVHELVQFQGPPERFLLELLAAQVRMSGAEAGAVLRFVDSEGKCEIVAVHPTIRRNVPAPPWLTEAVEFAPQVRKNPKPLVRPVGSNSRMLGVEPQKYMIMLPIPGDQGIRGISAFLIDGTQREMLDRTRERLELSLSLLGSYETRLALRQQHLDVVRLKQALETLDAFNQEQKFTAAAMALCNEVAARWQSDRVSIGLLKGRYVVVRAMSHTEKFTRKMDLVQAIESAMEEALDQNLEIVRPATPQVRYVHRAADELSQKHGPNAIVSVPLRRDDEAVGVITAERAMDRPFSNEEIETLRLLGDLAAPRLVERYEQDRWLGARLAADVRKSAGHLLGPQYTWVKLAAIAVCALILFLAFARGPDRVSAPFTIQPQQKRIVAAPFDGFLEQVHVEPNDEVEAGVTVLGELDTSELQYELNSARAELLRYQKEAQLAMDQEERVRMQIAQAQAQQTRARIALLEQRIARGKLLAPISGRIVSEDLSANEGIRVQTGQPLFEIAPVRKLRAELYVDEDRIVDVVSALQRVRGGPAEPMDDVILESGLPTDEVAGQLATSAYPADSIPFVVEWVNPVAETREQKNVFKVRVRLLVTRPWMQPGMEGIAKVDVGEALYIRMWTRDFENWLRMTLWW